MNTHIMTTLGIHKWITETGGFHRYDGPSWNDSTCAQHWFVHDFEHRLDGPARIVINGGVDWMIFGYRCEHKRDTL